MNEAATAPPPGMVHVWRVAPAGDDRRTGARRALGEILAAYLGGPTAAELSVDAGGKPRLAVAPERLSFNLSHSGDLALVAIARGGTEVGVDVERLRPRRDLVRLAERRLPPADAAAVAAADETEREATFYAAWTRHEARVKCTGGGLAGPPPGPEVVARQLPIDAGYAAAVALDLAGVGASDLTVSVRPWIPEPGPGGVRSRSLGRATGSGATRRSRHRPRP